MIRYIWTSSWRSWGPLFCQNRNWGLCFLNTPKFSFWIKTDRTGAVTTSFWKRVARTYLLCNKHSKTPLHTYQKEYITFLNYILKEALFFSLKVLLFLGLCSPVWIWQLHTHSWPQIVLLCLIFFVTAITLKFTTVLMQFQFKSPWWFPYISITANICRILTIVPQVSKNNAFNSSIFWISLYLFYKSNYYFHRFFVRGESLSWIIKMWTSSALWTCLFGPKKPIMDKKCQKKSRRTNQWSVVPELLPEHSVTYFCCLFMSRLRTEKMEYAQFFQT